ncbi:MULTISPECIES: barstar family protein [unclassified Streptomyces]|uniref:barstar family protein n=1 Tax=unclassified Streptomyces TaxID=2593676 RepID=UPI00338D57B6
MSRALEKPDEYDDNWDALRDLLRERGASTLCAIAVVFSSAPAFLRADVHGFVRAVSVLQNLSQELSDIDEPNGQLELSSPRPPGALSRRTDAARAPRSPTRLRGRRKHRPWR